MSCAPLPQNCQLQESSEGVVRFQDTRRSIVAFEHPLTWRFRRALERERLDLPTIRSKRPLQCLLSIDYKIGQTDAHVRISPACQDCHQTVSTKSCLTCSQSFCDFCFELTHAHSRTHHSIIPTPAGSHCNERDCDNEPRVWCKDCNYLLCMPCFVETHSRSLDQHNALYLEYANGNQLHDSHSCSECQNPISNISCDYCKRVFCDPCFRLTHNTSASMQHHTASLRIVRPVCMTCRTTRAGIFCENCSELFCSECFGRMHANGNRFFHHFTDATNILLLIEKLDPDFQQELITSRMSNLQKIMRIQALIRGFLGRQQVRRIHSCATRIQKVWRGYRTRSKPSHVKKAEPRKPEPPPIKSPFRFRSLSRTRT